MKIHEYNQMMNYLTRKSPPERTRLAKGTTSDTKVTPKKAKILEYIDDNIAMYEPDTASKEQLEGLEKRLANARAHVTPEKKKMSKQDEYNTYFNKKSPKYYKAEKPKPNGTTTFTSDDWDLIINNTEFPHEMFDDSWTKNKAGILEYELSQEYWLEQYDNYINQGGMLSFKEFMQQQNNMKVSRAIDNRVKEKMKTEGIAQILSIPFDKI
mgnify:CR=1 FL=1